MKNSSESKPLAERIYYAGAVGIVVAFGLASLRHEVKEWMSQNLNNNTPAVAPLDAGSDGETEK